MSDIVCDVLTYCELVSMVLIHFKAKITVNNSYANLERYRNMPTTPS